MSELAIAAGALAIPFGWERLDREPSASAREAAIWANAGVAQFLLHSADVDAALRPVEERLGEALAPVVAKLDLIVELLQRLSYREVRLPTVATVEFRGEDIAWLSPELLPSGAWLRFSLYFHPSYLEPVVLYGRVCGCVEQRGACRIEARLDPLPQATEEALARLAFLAHRRQLAQRPAAGIARGPR